MGSDAVAKAAADAVSTRQQLGLLFLSCAVGICAGATLWTGYSAILALWYPVHALELDPVASSVSPRLSMTLDTSSPALLSLPITAVAVDHALQRLVVATRDGRVISAASTLSSTDRVTLWPDVPLAPAAVVTGIGVAPLSHGVWISTHHHGVYHAADPADSWARVAVCAGHDDTWPWVHGIAVSPDEAMLAVSMIEKDASGGDWSHAVLSGRSRGRVCVVDRTSGTAVPLPWLGHLPGGLVILPESRAIVWSQVEHQRLWIAHRDASHPSGYGAPTQLTQPPLPCYPAGLAVATSSSTLSSASVWAACAAVASPVTRTVQSSVWLRRLLLPIAGFLPRAVPPVAAGEAMLVRVDVNAGVVDLIASAPTLLSERSALDVAVVSSSSIIVATGHDAVRFATTSHTF